jgi:hypothetical protein
MLSQSKQWAGFFNGLLDIGREDNPNVCAV